MVCLSPAGSDQYTLLKNVADILGQAAVSGNLSQSIGFNVSSVGVILPSPPSNDPAWSEVRWKQNNFIYNFIITFFFTANVRNGSNSA